MNVAGLFSGIGGLELPFHQAGACTLLLCDNWESSQAVLRTRFPGVPLHDDVTKLARLPRGTDVLTAGFPCTDLSQAGKTAGITGKASGLVANVFRLLEKSRIQWLVLENVRNMLVLDGGHAMSYLVKELERLGFRWAYRLVDSRFSGVPHRRHRVLFVASRDRDPRQVLFADNGQEPEQDQRRDDAYGFYWTEGYTGLGWAKDAVPPLKGGSTVGIPSPPCIWVPEAQVGRRLLVPLIEDAEALQGFPRKWTSPAESEYRNGPRWKLVGNAVTVGVGTWLVNRLLKPGDVVVDSSRWSGSGKWPDAAYGHRGEIHQFAASHWPTAEPYRHLSDVVNLDAATPLSWRATAGFLQRTTRSSLRFDPKFLADVRGHVQAMDPATGRHRQLRLADGAIAS
jgi:DNA (cytosine-5)-methyltransferase 1